MIITNKINDFKEEKEFVNSKEYEGGCVDSNNINSKSLFLINKGNYLSFPINPFFDFSNYSGLFFKIENNLFKTIESLRLHDNTGLKIPKKIINGIFYVEKIYDDCIERFTLDENGLIYELDSEKELQLELNLDFRWIHDYDDKGRIYDFKMIDDSLLITYKKYSDYALKQKNYNAYFLINGIKDFSRQNQWVKRSYAYDFYRKSLSELYVYDAIKLNCSRITLFMSFSFNKLDVIKKALYLKKNLNSIKRSFLSIEKKLVDKKSALPSNVFLAYSNSLHVLNNLILKSTTKGIWAGIPWFYQYWSRDELVSLNSIINEDYFEKKMIVEILKRHLNSILSNGRLPNIFNDNNSLGSADSIGWLFKTISRILDTKAQNKYFSKYELNFIFNRLKYSIDNILKNYYSDGLVRNGPLETWMDTVIENDTREGYRIEIQALFLCMLELFNKIKSKYYKNDIGYEEYYEIEKSISSAVKQRFLVNNYLNDGWNCVHSDVSRPNIFLAYYFYPKLFSSNEWEKVFDNALSRLWFEWGNGKGGLSTIDKEHYLYQPRYTGIDNKSYHRGDSWFYVNNIAAVCMLSLNKEKYISYIEKIIGSSTEDILFNGFIGCASELSSSSVFESGGCLCQAWSIATYIQLVDEFFRQ
ncbi:MAG: amylo-alpha-1,6-glucosidase [Candidatus Woesearchaeota archaeon]